MNVLDSIKSVLFGVAIGDALGVPVEFKSRNYLRQNPVKDFIGFGTHNQPEGTFSDDSSLTFCLAEALTRDFNLQTIGNNFLNWAYNAYWTATDEVFDIGIATGKAIENLAKGVNPEKAGGTGKNDNGNGSLMRISPLVFYVCKMPIKDRYEIVKKVSSITHRHIRSVISCFYYIEFMIELLNGSELLDTYKKLKKEIPQFLKKLSIVQSEIDCFERLLQHDIYELPEKEIKSGGYVLDTLEAGIWCLLTTNSFKDAVLKAVNLGDDTDTTGCVTGGIAGLFYGWKNIPDKWIKKLSRKKDIESLAERLNDKIL